jgi:rhodanese-related sulfurtransferase
MSGQKFQRLRAPDVATWLAAHPGALVLDARDAAHHARGHWPGSLRLDGRNHEMLLMREAKSRPVFIYCYHGNSSQTYADMFADFGFQQVSDLVGGWEAWGQSGLPLPASATVDAAAARPEPEPQAQATAPDAHTPEALRTWLSAEGFVDAHTPAAHGNTPLMHAAWRGLGDIVELLLVQGVSLSATNGDGNNAVWMACVSKQPALVKRLVEAGVPIDHLNLTGATSLMYAASSSKPEVVAVLLEMGADPFIQTQDDYTAMDMAASLPCLQLLRAATKAGKAQKAA